MTDQNRFYGKVKIVKEQIQQIFEIWNIPEEFRQNSIIKFEDLIKYFISNQMPEIISREDYLSYIGTLSCVLWVDRDRYQENPPKSISIHQKPNGCFKTYVI